MKPHKNRNRLARGKKHAPPPPLTMLNVCERYGVSYLELTDAYNAHHRTMLPSPLPDRLAGEVSLLVA